MLNSFINSASDKTFFPPNGFEIKPPTTADVRFDLKSSTEKDPLTITGSLCSLIVKETDDPAEFSQFARFSFHHQTEQINGE